MNLLKLILTAVAAFSLLVSAPAYAVSRTGINGYKTFVFGESPGSVNAKLRAGYRFVQRFSDGSADYRGNISGFREVRVVPFYVNNKLTEVVLGFFPQGGMNTVDVYYNLKSKLLTQYGEPTQNIWKVYQGEETLADDQSPEALLQQEVLNGRIYYYARWEFENGTQVSLETDKQEDGNQRCLIRYFHATLCEREEAKQKVKDTQDL